MIQKLNLILKNHIQKDISKFQQLLNQKELSQLNKVKNLNKKSHPNITQE